MTSFKIGETFDLFAMPEEDVRAWLGNRFVDVLQRWRASGAKACSARVTSIDGDHMTLDILQPGRIENVDTTVRIVGKDWSVSETFGALPRPSRGRIGPLTEAWLRIRDEAPESDHET